MKNTGLAILIISAALISGCQTLGQKKGIGVHYGHICATNAVVKEVKQLPSEVKFKDINSKPEVTMHCELRLQTDPGDLFVFLDKDLNCDPKVVGARVSVYIHNGKVVGINSMPNLFLDELKIIQ